jgi:hypothetical protein
MKTCAFIIVVAILSFGCATRRENVPLNLNANEEIIRQELKGELIPFPQTTPFDSDAKKRNAYLTAFSKAWNFVVSGDALHATVGFSIPSGFEEPWKVGWNDGYKIASDRWMQELEKLRNEHAHQS